MKSKAVEGIKVSEIFYSIQGEGRFAGIPSVFLRTFGCNFTCRGFGQGRDPKTWVPLEKMLHNTEDLTGKSTLRDLDVPSIGCDSSASWAPRYKHLSPMMPINAIVDRLNEACPFSHWRSPAGEAIHLVITGGEPLLKGWQRAYYSLLYHAGLAGLTALTFESNGTQPLTPEFQRALSIKGRRFHLNFSISPKLASSGESRAKAIRPDVIKSYGNLPDSYIGLKFVVAKEADLMEVMDILKELRSEECRIDSVMVMAAGAVGQAYQPVARHVASLALSYGLRFSPRLQVDLFRNEYGT